MTRFYNYSGSTVLSALQLGYAYDFSDNRHLISAGTLAFRYHLFELNLLQFELGVSPFDATIGWNPSVGAAIPLSKSWAVGVYGAVSLDFSPVVAWLDDDYGYNSDDLYLQLAGGVALEHSGFAYLPFRLFAEYRYTCVGDYPSSGLYLGLRWDLAAVWR